MQIRKNNLLRSQVGLLSLALSIVLLGCASGTKEGQQAATIVEGDVVAYNGNTFTLSEAMPDTIIVFDPIKEENVTTVVNTHQIPIAVNGKPIYKIADVASPSVTDPIVTYLMDNLKDMITTYRDSNIVSYRINLRDIVIGEDGHVIYYSLEGLHCTTTGNQHRTLASDYLKPGIDSVLMHAPAITPVKVDGKNVAVLCDISLSDGAVVVKDGVAKWEK